MLISKHMLLIVCLAWLPACSAAPDRCEGVEETDVATAIDWLNKKISVRIGDDSHRPANEVLADMDFDLWIREGKSINKLALALTCLLQQRDERVDLAHVALAIGYVGDQTATNALLGVIDSDDPYLRVDAVVALGKIRDSRAIPALCRAVLTDKNTSVRANAAIALANFRDPIAVRHIELATKDKCEFVRDRAIDALEIATRNATDQ